MVDFGSKTTLLKSFILLAYSDILNTRTYDLVGVDSRDSTVLKGYRYNVNKKTYQSQETFSYSHGREVHMVIPGDFRGNGSTDYVLVTKTGDGSYSSSIYVRDDEKREIGLGTSNAPPMLYASPASLRPQLLMQTSSGLKSMWLDKNENLQEEAVSYGELHPEHTSAFVDVEGTMKASLCLVTAEDGGRSLKILANRKEGFQEIFKMGLPHDMGPIVFEDFNGNGMNDMAFVTMEEGKYQLIVHTNTNSRIDDAEKKTLLGGYVLSSPTTQIFSDKEYRAVIDLDDLFPDLTPVVRSKHFQDMPSGIFTADLTAKGKPDIFLIMENKQGETCVAVLENVSTPSSVDFRVSKKLETLSSIKNVISMSCCDYNNKGREAIFLNRVENGEAVLEAYENDFSKENLKLTLSTILPGVPKQQYGSGVPGVSYLLSYKNGSRIFVANQMSYSSFVHLKHSSAYIGLGLSSLIIDQLVIGVPGHGLFGGPYRIGSAAIPNTDLIVYLKENQDYSVESHFIIGEHFRTIIGVLVTVAAVNLVFILLLQLRDRRREVQAKNMDKLHPLFSTLQ